MTANALAGYVPNPQVYGTNALVGVAPPNTIAGQSGRYAGMTVDQIVAMMGSHGYTQEGVNRVYELRGLSNPPTVPPSLEAAGAHPGAGRARGVWVDSSGKTVKTNSNPDAAPWHNFDMSFNTQAVDPYRQRSGISNVAGGLLNAVGSYVGGPVWQAFTGVADAANNALGNNDGTSYTDGRRSGADRAGAVIGAVAGSMNGPGSYGANNPSGTAAQEAAHRGISESGAMGGASSAGGSMAGKWGDWINLAGSLYGAYAQGQGAKNASNAEQAGIQAGIGEQRREFDLSRGDQMPWVQSGTAALNRLNDPNAFTQSPGYAFTRDEALKGVENSASAKGGLYSGNAGRALEDRAANLGSQEYGNWFNQNASLAGLGQTSAQSLGALGQNNANNVSNLLNQQGNARASGIEGQTNALTGGISDFLSWYNRRKQGGG